MKSYLIEFAGTFFLVLAIALTGNPLVIGGVLMVLIYSGFQISGAHYNPAVTIAIIIRKRIEVPVAFGYILAQILGAFFAALVFNLAGWSSFFPQPDPTVPVLAALLLEFALTFVLVLVILIVATHKKLEGNSFYGFAIGLTVSVISFTGGPISGGAYNPAVGLGPILMDTLTGGQSIANVWLYLLGPFGGGIAGALVFSWLNHEE